MAAHALMPARSPANTDRYAFTLALAHFAEARHQMTALPSTSTIADEIAAGEAMDRAYAALATTAAPDHAALSTKLRLTLTAAGVPLPLIDCLTGDVRRLGFVTGGRA